MFISYETFSIDSTQKLNSFELYPVHVFKSLIWQFIQLCCCTLCMVFIILSWTSRKCEIMSKSCLYGNHFTSYVGKFAPYVLYDWEFRGLLFVKCVILASHMGLKTWILIIVDVTLWKGLPER